MELIAEIIVRTVFALASCILGALGVSLVSDAVHKRVGDISVSVYAVIGGALLIGSFTLLMSATK